MKLAVAQNSAESFSRAREEALKEMSATHPEFHQILYKPLDLADLGIFWDFMVLQLLPNLQFLRLLPWTGNVSRAQVVLTLVDRLDKPISKPLATLGMSWRWFWIVLACVLEGSQEGHDVYLYDVFVPCAVPVVH